MNAPENTAKRDPLLHLLGMMGHGSSRYITDMEADGQRQLVNSDTLPAKAPWDDLAELGFVKGDPVEGDDLFVHCTLPDGWKREASDHDMWSYITDERGVRRIGVFYKAAFYDRRAQASIQNVGDALAAEAIYGDGPADIPASWELLTDKERADFRESLADYLRNAAEYPDIYGKRADRVHAIADRASR